jgi:SAM-dependent methyltransferase
MAAFGPIAPHYDALMSRVPYAMWLEYYKLLLDRQQARPASFLDVCCGTGTLAEMLAGEARDVAGIDLSPAMIAEARTKAVRLGIEVAYHTADVRDFDLGRKFGAAYSFFDSLNYVATLDGLRSAVAAVARHIEPGGSFVFDLNTDYAFVNRLFDQQDLRSTSRVRYRWTGEYDPDSRIIRVSMRFWVAGERFQETHVQRAHRHEEVLDALGDAGFVKVQSFHSYTLDPPRKESDRVHYAAIRAG